MISMIDGTVKSDGDVKELLNDMCGFLLLLDSDPTLQEIFKIALNFRKELIEKGEWKADGKREWEIEPNSIQYHC